jgi:hypothetical protein
MVGISPLHFWLSALGSTYMNWNSCVKIDSTCDSSHFAVPSLSCTAVDLSVPFCLIYRQDQRILRLVQLSFHSGFSLLTHIKAPLALPRPLKSASHLRIVREAFADVIGTLLSASD